MNVDSVTALLEVPLLASCLTGFLVVWHSKSVQFLRVLQSLRREHYRRTLHTGSLARLLHQARTSSLAQLLQQALAQRQTRTVPWREEKRVKTFVLRCHAPLPRSLLISAADVERLAEQTRSVSFLPHRCAESALSQCYRVMHLMIRTGTSGHSQSLANRPPVPSAYVP